MCTCILSISHYECMRHGKKIKKENIQNIEARIIESRKALLEKILWAALAYGVKEIKDEIRKKYLENHRDKSKHFIRVIDIRINSRNLIF